MKETTHHVAVSVKFNVKSSGSCQHSAATSGTPVNTSIILLLPEPDPCLVFGLIALVGVIPIIN